MRKVSWWWGLFVVLSLSGCFQTVETPKDLNINFGAKVSTPSKSIKTIPSVVWPEEPCHHLKELISGIPEDRKLAVVLAANKACIDNLEEALRQTGVKEPK